MRPAPEHPTKAKPARTTAAPSQPGALAAIPGVRASGPGKPDGKANPRVPGTRPQRRPTPGQPPAAQPQPRSPDVSAATAEQLFIRDIVPGAVAAQRKYGVPAAVTIAQAIEESGWGRSSLATRDHNLFGMKGSGPAGSVVLPTQEFEQGQWITLNSAFRVYHDLAQSIDDHGEHLATDEAYQHAMSFSHNPDAFAAALTGVYATDPAYGAKLVGLMRHYDLYRFDATSRAGSPAPRASAGAGGGSTPRSSPPPSTPTPSTPRTDPGTPNVKPGTPNVKPSTPDVSPGAPDVHPAVPAGHARTPAKKASPKPPAPPVATPAATDGGAAIPGLPPPSATPPGGSPGVSQRPPRWPEPTPQGRDRAAGAQGSEQAPGPLGTSAAPVTQSAGARRMPISDKRPSSPPDRTVLTSAQRYEPQIPASVAKSFATSAKRPLARAEGVYRDVCSTTGLHWELLAACDWMQCEARTRYSPVHGERLGTANPDGTLFRTRSAALEQCADDLVRLAYAVYRIDLTAPDHLSVRDLSNVFAAFRWGALLRLHHTSAMEFPYSVAGLTGLHTRMRWPDIAEPNLPDKPGGRFHRPFGAVPVVLMLDYPATA
jgi:flagellum-specific peptidoglycan hydrolase FlgJ